MPGSLSLNEIRNNAEHLSFMKIGQAKLFFGGAIFFLLTVGIFWYQFSSIEAGAEAPAWDRLNWYYLPLILLCLPIETLASGARIWLLCHVLGPRTTFWSCIKAEWANVAVATLTPSQTGGGPAQIYILSRSGVSAATAVTISLLSFVGTMLGLFCMGLYSLSVSGIGEVGVLYVTAVWTLFSISAAMVLAGVCPDLFRKLLGAISRVFWRIRGRSYSLHPWWPPQNEQFGEPADRFGKVTARLIDLIYNYRSDMTRFLRTGKRVFVWVCLLSITFLFARCVIPYLCIRFLGIETSDFRTIVELQLALTFLVFFVPTPGAAGLAEAASSSIMASVVPVGFVPHYNLLWRFSTLYLSAIAGLFCLVQALARDTGRLIFNPNQQQFFWRKHG
jgi:glycosyltransferase 2 family protein